MAQITQNDQNWSEMAKNDNTAKKLKISKNTVTDKSCRNPEKKADVVEIGQRVNNGRKYFGMAENIQTWPKI